jgi:hypothetical protein
MVSEILAAENVRFNLPGCGVVIALLIVAQLR